jgi:hypothetical protein
MLSSFYTEVSYAWLVGTQATHLTALELTGRLAASRQRRANQHIAASWQANCPVPWCVCAQPFVKEVGGQSRCSGPEAEHGQAHRLSRSPARRSGSAPA